MERRIRPWKLSDAEALAEAINNKKVQDNLRDGLPYPYTKADAEDFIRAMLAADPDRTFAFAIVLNDLAIGSIAVFRRENVHFRTAELGYYIGQPYWGRGLCAEAVEQICRYVFDNTNIVRIFADPYAYNLPSCRVLEKCGFQCEGTLKKNAEKNGVLLDMKMYALIKED